MARLPRSSRARATVLVLTVVVVVVASTFGPVLLRGGGPPEIPEYAVDDLVPERAPAEGDVAIERRAEGGVVLVDLAHRNRVGVDELQPLLETVTVAGYTVDLLRGDESLDRELARADAFVVVDPGTAYGETEAARVEAFAERGGRVLLVGEPTRSVPAGLTLATQRGQLTSLSSRFGLQFGESYLYNMATNDGNHRNVFVEPAGSSAVTDGVSRVALYTATTVRVRDGRPVLVAGPDSRSSRTDATGSYAVAAVSGNVLAIGDGTFLRQGNVNVVDNEVLLRNVVRFLVSGTKAPTVEAYPAYVGESPRVHYTGPALLPAAQSLATDLRARGYRPSVSLGTRNVAPDRTDVLVTTYGFLEERGALGTGVEARNDRVRVRGYESNARGIIVVRAPAEGYDLVVAADGPVRVERAVRMLANGDLDRYRLGDRTAVVRTDAAVRQVVVDGGAANESGTSSGSTDANGT